MVRFIYNIGFHIFLLASAPFYLLKMWRRGNWRPGFGERFARYGSKFKQAITNRDIIWLHAVSVGEVNVCTQLIRALEPRAPTIKIVVSTTTSTGMAELQKRLPSHISKIYYPLDANRYVRRALRLISPEAIVLMEAEIWPNFLWRAADLGTPVYLVNARLSEKSFRGYGRWGFLFRRIFRSFAGIGCQNEADAKRLESLGCRPERIHVIGNLKFDAATVVEKRVLDVPAMFSQLGVPADAPVLVAGSTHDGEEKILGEVFQKLRARFPTQVKIGPVERIRDLVNLALPGVTLTPMPVAPRQIPFHTGANYFELETRNSDLWRQLEQSGGIAMHIAGDFPGLDLAFWAIRS